VTYADDLVILCRKGKAEEALQHLRELMGKLSGDGDLPVPGQKASAHARVYDDAGLVRVLR
jgi:hypothetical protein